MKSTISIKNCPLGDGILKEGLSILSSFDAHSISVARIFKHFVADLYVRTGGSTKRMLKLCGNAAGNGTLGSEKI